MPPDSTSDVPVATVATKKPRAVPAPQQKPAAPQKHADGAFSIEAPDLSNLLKEQNIQAYWCGATKDSRVQTIYVKGVCFPRWTHIPTVLDKLDKDGYAQFAGNQQPKLGTFVDLTEAKVADVLAAIPGRVLRKIGDRGGVVLDISRPNYRADVKRDFPLGQFIYMVPKDGLGIQDRETYPTPLISPKE